MRTDLPVPLPVPTPPPHPPHSLPPFSLISHKQITHPHHPPEPDPDPSPGTPIGTRTPLRKLLPEKLPLGFFSRETSIIKHKASQLKHHPRQNWGIATGCCIQGLHNCRERKMHNATSNGPNRRSTLVGHSAIHRGTNVAHLTTARCI